MATINNKNVNYYVDNNLIDPYKIKIDLNVTKTANDNVHRWITLADAIKGGYKFNFDYEVKNKPLPYTILPEATVYPQQRLYSVGGGELKRFYSLKEADEYIQAHPKSDPSETALNWILPAAIKFPVLTATALAGYFGDRLFHKAVKDYNGDDIDKNGMWVYNPGGWVTGYGAAKGLELGKNIATNVARSITANMKMRTRPFGRVQTPEISFNAEGPSYTRLVDESPKLTPLERAGVPKSERNLSTHGNDYSNPVSYGRLYQGRSINPQSNKFGELIDEGSEAVIFEDPSNPNMVLKVNTDYRLSLQDFFNNYVIPRNRVPYQKPIILRGVTEEGYPVFNLEKVFPMTDEQYMQNISKIKEMLRLKGFVGDLDLEYISNGNIRIGDFHPGNVAFDSDGNIVFIDIDAYKEGLKGSINPQLISVDAYDLSPAVENIKKTVKSIFHSKKEPPKYADLESEVNDYAEEFYENVLKPLFNKYGLKHGNKLFNWLNRKIQIKDDLGGPLGIHWIYGKNEVVKDHPIFMKNAGIHEAASHGTDRLIPRYIRKIYSELIDFLEKKAGPIEVGRGNEWMEMRATLNQLKDYVRRYLRTSDEAVNITEESLSKIPDWVLLWDLKSTGGYGSKYVLLYDKLTPEDKKTFVQMVRKALLYPVVAGAIATVGLNNL